MTLTPFKKSTKLLNTNRRSIDEFQLDEGQRPPGKYVISEKPTGQLVLAEGTSFAAPQVTGIVGLALELLPALNRQIVEEIFWYTGQNGPKGSQDAASPKIINSYKFIRVVERLASALKKFPTKNDAFVRLHISEKIKNQSTFDFVEEANDILKVAATFKEEDCASLWKKIQTVRESFFLNPTNSVRENLVRLYTLAGYQVNAEYFANLKL